MFPACHCSSVRRLARRSGFPLLEYGFPGRNQRFLPALATKPPPEVLLNASRHTSDVGRWFGMTEKGYPLVRADIIRPPPDLCRAGGVAEQAAVGSAEGGAVKQSEAILDGVFLSSPILSFARKKKEWEKEKTCFLRWIFFCLRRCGRCAGPSIFLVLGKKDTGEKEPLSLSEGFLGSVSARGRSLRSL